MNKLRLTLRNGWLKRTLLFASMDFLSVAGGFGVAYLLFYGRFPSDLDFHTLEVLALVVFLCHFFWHAIFRLYHLVWKFYSYREVAETMKGAVLGFVTWFPLLFLARVVSHDFPAGLGIVAYGAMLIGFGGSRAAKRLAYEFFSRRYPHQRQRVLVVGAGNAGEQILRDMARNPKSPYYPVAVIDDDPEKKGTYLHGVRVVGDRTVIPQVVRDYRVEMALIAIPSASSREIRDIVRRLREAGVRKIKILPGVTELASGHVTLMDLRDVAVEDLLGREPVEIDLGRIRESLAGKSVLITGAAGSIGSEIARQVARFAPELLVLLDEDETELFWLERTLREHHPTVNIRVSLCDIRDQGKVQWIFQETHPQVVFHAAAYKHVPVMEAFPEEAVKTNVFGTKYVAEAAIANGTERFVLISTDKAVNPTSVMGATKRLAEMLILQMSGGPTALMAVRFGNVLGSRGSVIEIFRKQIRHGGPVTVTHPEMRRYFMTVSEAVLLVLQAATMGQGGEVFVLDMGQPVRILDLAREMIRLSGYEPDVEIPIVFTGIRPGEKLFEELLTAEEGTEATTHEKIFRAKIRCSLDGEAFRGILKALEEAAARADGSKIRALLQRAIPTYQPQFFDTHTLSRQKKTRS